MSTTYNDYSIHFKLKNKNIFSGSTDFSLDLIYTLIEFQPFQYLFTSSDCLINFNILKIYCLKKNIVFFQFMNFYYYNNFFKYNIYNYIKIKISNINSVIIIDYGLKFSLNFLKYSTGGLINVHFSILPIFKGGKPLWKSLKFKNFFKGISIFYINKFFDSGNLIFKFKFKVSKKKSLLNFFYSFLIKNFNIFFNYLKINYFFCYSQYKTKILDDYKKIK